MVVALSSAQRSRSGAAHAESQPFTLRSSEPGLTILQWDAGAARELSARRSRTIIEAFPLTASRTVDLEIEPFSVTGPETRFVVGRKNGSDQPLDFDPSDIALFRGRVTGRAGSHVYLALAEGRARGKVVRLR